VTLIALLLTGCLEGADPDDEVRIFLQPSHVVGDWILVTEEPSEIRGLYRKDTIHYRIGLDNLPSDMRPYDRDTYEPYEDVLSFVTVYDRGSDYAFIYDPEETYDHEEDISALMYSIVEGLPSHESKSTIVLMMPEVDSLVIKRGSEIIGTRRNRR
jgi:hypothetical protein